MKKICAYCKELKKVHIRDKDKEPVCYICYVKLFQPKEICIHCKKLKLVKKRDNKNPICNTCYKKYYQPKKECAHCHEIKISYKKINSDSICPKCYKLYYQPKKNCSICYKLKTVNSYKNNKPICPQCYKNPIEKCYKCGKRKEVWRRIDNKPYCMICNSNYKRLNDNNYYIREKIRKRFRAVLNIYTKEGKIQESRKYGIDYLGIINHIGKCPGKFKDYHIDHIFPLIAFNLNDANQLKAAFAPENHQWLLAIENIKKKDRYDIKLFKEYLKEHGC